jgi:hypothetical protein
VLGNVSKRTVRRAVFGDDDIDLAVRQLQQGINAGDGVARAPPVDEDYEGFTST